MASVQQFLGKPATDVPFSPPSARGEADTPVAGGGGACALHASSGHEQREAFVKQPAPASHDRSSGLAAKGRRLCRFLHRDLGYLFFGVTLAYAASGLALNHLHDWNPNYSISRQETRVAALPPEQHFTRDDAANLLSRAGVDQPYLKHYAPAPDQVRIFFQNGTATFNRSTGLLVVESLKRRPLLHTFNKLHYNPGRWWTWFADVFCVALLIIAISGLFLLRGYHGIARRGGVLVVIGILFPAILVILYL